MRLDEGRGFTRVGQSEGFAIPLDDTCDVELVAGVSLTVAGGPGGRTQVWPGAVVACGVLKQYVEFGGKRWDLGESVWI